MARRIRSTTAADEVAGADLGDRRRSERLRIITGQLESEPAKSFPRAMGSDAALEALYRFINNDAFSASDILRPHLTSTLERGGEAESVIAVHDTTHVEYGGSRTDLGPTTSKNRFGFIAHVTLLLAEADGLPLGVAHLETMMRTGQKWRKRKLEGQRGRVQSTDQGRESLRWLRATQAVETARSGRFEAIHVTDAEGDFFELLASLNECGARFVIRAGQLDRVVTCAGEACSLREVADAIKPQTWRTVELSERKHAPKASKTARRRHPNRIARTTELAIGAARIVIGKSYYSNLKSQPFATNAVRVWEPNPPPGQPATEWLLLTTEDVSTTAAMHRVVDIYRKRWVIEEYFKALKSGCSLEKRQVESYDALCKVLVLFIPIAYRILLLRGLERTDSQARASRAFSEVDLRLMAAAPEFVNARETAIFSNL